MAASPRRFVPGIVAVLGTGGVVPTTLAAERGAGRGDEGPGVVTLVVVLGLLALVVAGAISWWRRRLGAGETAEDTETAEETAADDGVDFDEQDLAEGIRRGYWRQPPPRREPELEIREVVELTPVLLRQLEWRRFEDLVSGYFGEPGWRVQRTTTGFDGGVDLLLYREGEHRPAAAVQCLTWPHLDEGVERLALLQARAQAERIERAICVTAGDGTPALRAAAAERGIELLDGAALVAAFGARPLEARDRIVRQVTRDDWRTPTCPRCEIKLVRRDAGPPEVWRCANFPRCQRTIRGPVSE